MGKVNIKDIRRQSKRAMIEDMVHHLRKTEIRSNLNNFVLPLSNNMRIFKGDSVAISEA